MVKLSNGRNVLPNLGKPSWIFSDRELNSSYSSHTVESKSERLARPETCRDLSPTGNVKLGIKRFILDVIVFAHCL